MSVEDVTGVLARLESFGGAFPPGEYPRDTLEITRPEAQALVGMVRALLAVVEASLGAEDDRK